MRLATLHPTSAEAVWSAVATGKLPQKNGVRSAAVYRPAAGEDPIRLLPDFCYSSGLLRFGVLAEEPLTLRRAPRAAALEHPDAARRPRRRRELAADLSGAHRPRVRRQRSLPAAVGQPGRRRRSGCRLSARAPGRHDAGQPGLLERSAGDCPRRHDDHDARAASASRAGRPAVRTGRARGSGRRSRPRSRSPATRASTRSGTTSCAMRCRRSSATSRRTIAGGSARSSRATTASSTRRSDARWRSLGPDDLLLVVSGYGMEPLGFGKRALEQLLGDPDVSGTHEGAPDGFLMAYGAPVAKARQAAPRVDRRRRADRAVLPRPADRPRHGRLRADRHFSARVHRRTPDHVHPNL